MKTDGIPKDGSTDIHMHTAPGVDDGRRRRANMLLSERLVDFIGSDAHRADRRPPLFCSGMQAFRRLYPEEYASLVAARNPRAFLL